MASLVSSRPIEASQSKHSIIELQLAEKKFGLKLNLDGVFHSLGFWLGPVLDAEKIAVVTKQTVEETPDCKSADEINMATVQDKHFQQHGGLYFADCVSALKGGHSRPSPSVRCSDASFKPDR